MNRSIRHPYFFSILRVDSFTKPLSTFALKRFIHNAGQQQQVTVTNKEYYLFHHKKSQKYL